MRPAAYILLFVLFFTGIAGYPKDTIFSAYPDTRNIDTSWMQTVFSDDFNGTELDQKVWVVEDGTRGAGDHENSPQNIQVENGILKLIARSHPGKVDTLWDGTIYTRGFTTAEIWTRWNRYLYGSFEARCKMPEGLGLWFAYWLHGPGGDGYPEDDYGSEVDIAEADCNQVPVELIHALHYWLPDGTEMKINDREKAYPDSFMEEWHVYKMIWDPFEVNFFIDGKRVWDRTRFSTGGNFRIFDVHLNEIKPGTKYYIHEWFPRHHMSTVFQMALDSAIVGNEKLLPAAMEVDYVRVKQFFKSPEIVCPDTLNSIATATLETDNQATNISWVLTPSALFTGLLSGDGKVAELRPSANSIGDGKITYYFKMPSGEAFKTEKKMRINTSIVSSEPTLTYPGDFSLTVYPNPARDQVQVALKSESGTLMPISWKGSVYNQLNQVVQQAAGSGSVKWIIDTGNWPAGIYFVKIKLENKFLAGKFAVLK